MTIFDLIQAPEIAAYWTEQASNKIAYLGEELFPSDKKLGLDLSWIKGAKGLPIVLNPSTFDVKAKPRARIGFDKLTTDMPFFKESTYIDEKLRQELNKVLETGNQLYIDAVVNQIFNDEMALLDGAKAQRERMRMQALTTGYISISANGTIVDYDYMMPSANKPTVTTSWSNAAADIIGDIRKYQDQIEDATGTRPTRAICSRKTFGYLRQNTAILKSIKVLNDGTVPVSDKAIKNYLVDELELSLAIYTKKYVDETGATKAYVPDDLFVLFPDGDLGKTWFGTTPEESDLMTGSVANVSIVDTGVAITSVKQTDPVNVETKVTMICLPSFEVADQVCIIDVIA